MTDIILLKIIPFDLVVGALVGSPAMLMAQSLSSVFKLLKLDRLDMAAEGKQYCGLWAFVVQSQAGPSYSTLVHCRANYRFSELCGLT